MKRILLLTSAMIAFAGSANADVSFISGSASLVAADSFFGPDVYQLDAGVDVAFDTDYFGFQFGGSHIIHTNFDNSITLTDFNLHVYKNGAGDNKYGIYVNSLAIPIGGGGSSITGYGVEGMFGLGPITIDASLGGLTGLGLTQTIYLGIIGAEYNITDSISVHADYNSMFFNDNSISSYTIGAAYEIADTNLSITADYMGFVDAPSDINQISLGLSYGFGPNKGHRLFDNPTVNFIGF